MRTLNVVRCAGIALQAGMLLWCGWMIGHSWATGERLGVALFILLFCVNARLLYGSLSD